MVTTATRFPTHTPQTASGRAADLLGELWARHDGHLSEMVRTMAGSAAVLGGYLDLSRAMKRSRLPRRTAETISIAIQARLGCTLCLEAHIAAGRAAGLSDDDIAHAVAGTATDPATAALVAYAIAVQTEPASIDPQQLTELRALGHRDRDLLDVIGLVTLNHLTGAFNLVAGLEPEEPMNTTTRLAAYGGVLAASFAGAAAVGAAVGPIDTGGQTHVVSGGHDSGGHGTDGEASPPPTVTARPGTSLDANGIRIAPDRAAVAARTATDYTFRLVDDRGNAITDYDVVHERPLHLIVASRDLTAYHHLHPEQDGDIWSVELPALDEGTYRVFADSRPTDRDAVTLGVDLLVADDVSTGVDSGRLRGRARRNTRGRERNVVVHRPTRRRHRDDRALPRRRRPPRRTPSRRPRLRPRPRRRSTRRRRSHHHVRRGVPDRRHLPAVPRLRRRRRRPHRRLHRPRPRHTLGRADPRRTLT